MSHTARTWGDPPGQDGARDLEGEQQTLPCDRFYSKLKEHSQVPVAGRLWGGEVIWRHNCSHCLHLHCFLSADEHRKPRANFGGDPLCEAKPKNVGEKFASEPWLSKTRKGS
jgi:hypothetical protein